MTTRTEEIAAKRANKGNSPTKACVPSTGAPSKMSSKSAKPKKKVTKNAAKKRAKKGRASKKAPMVNPVMTAPTKGELKKVVDIFMSKVHGGKKPGSLAFFKEAYKHILVKNTGRVFALFNNPDNNDSKQSGHQQVQCHVCANLEKSFDELCGNRIPDVTEGCKCCKKAFHANCFAVFHRPDLFINANPPVREELLTFLFHHLWSKDPRLSENNAGSHKLGYVQEILLHHEEKAVLAKKSSKKSTKKSSKKSPQTAEV